MPRPPGLTVRTLQHYDEIGLLAPSERTQAGHRLYGDADVGRLYEIRALRELGLGSLKMMFQEEGPERASQGQLDAGLMEYVGQAMRAST